MELDNSCEANMPKSKPFLKKLGVAAALASLVVGAASANPLSGSFALSGAFLPMLDGFTVSDLSNANAIDFMDGVTPSPGTPGPITVQSATGDFATLVPVGTVGTAADFAFGGTAFTGFPTPPITGFEQLGVGPALDVDLLNIHIVLRSDAFLNLQGSTLMHAASFDETAGTYLFSGRTDGTAARFAFDAVDAVAGIPEPKSLLLVGLGLVVAAVMRRKPSRKQ